MSARPKVLELIDLFRRTHAAATHPGQDVMAAARGQDIERLEQIKYANVERNGSISVVKPQDGKV